MRVLPKGWALTQIGDLFATLEDGRTLHQGWSPQCERGPAESGDEWGVLKTTAIQPAAFHPAHNKRLPASLEARPHVEVREGDLLITCAGPRARCGIACLVRNTRPRLMLSGKMYRFRMPEQFVSPRYIEFYLQSKAAILDIDRMKTGGSDSGLNLTHDRFRRLPIPLAPRPEQERIVAVIEEEFSRVDAGVALLELVSAKLEAYRIAVLNSAANGALSARWREQHPASETASELLQRILDERRWRWDGEQVQEWKDAAKAASRHWKSKYNEPLVPDTVGLPPLPEGWCWTNLDAVIVDGPQNGLYLPSGLYGRGHSILRIDDFQNGWVRSRDELNNVEADDQQALAFALHRGDLVINRVNSMTHLGKCLVVHQQLEGALFESNMMRARVAESMAARYVEIYLHSAIGRARLIKEAKWAVNQASINQTDVKRTLLPLPPVAEQEYIVGAVEDQLSVVQHLIGDAVNKRDVAQRLRQSILRQAFAGRLVPHDADNEPASILLERIAAERAGLKGTKLTRSHNAHANVIA